jgi:hypothetical protein
VYRASAESDTTVRHENKFLEKVGGIEGGVLVTNSDELLSEFGYIARNNHSLMMISRVSVKIDWCLQQMEWWLLYDPSVFGGGCRRQVRKGEHASE